MLYQGLIYFIVTVFSSSAWEFIKMYPVSQTCYSTICKSWREKNRIWLSMSLFHVSVILWHSNQWAIYLRWRDKKTSTSLSMISGSAGRLSGRVTDDCTYWSCNMKFLSYCFLPSGFNGDHWSVSYTHSNTIHICFKGHFLAPLLTGLAANW